MWRRLKFTWTRLCNRTKMPEPDQIPLREKAIAVATRVSVEKVGDSIQASCPMCLKVIQDSVDSDLNTTLGVHMSIWHHEDVKLQWELMQKHKEVSVLHLPSLMLGVGIVAGFGVLLAFAAKYRASVVRELDNQELS